MEIKLIINKFLHLFEVTHICEKNKNVYLTFDDGPEGEVTEWILDELKKYNAKATFFCKGENAERNPELLQRIINEGHAVGNHTYSHISSFEASTDVYVSDVEKANRILNTHLFRPPWGALCIGAFLKLTRKYKIIYWSLMSGDTFFDKLNLQENMQRLYNQTKCGEIVLFHSCARHEKETRKILPLYLSWLQSNGYKCIFLS